MKSDLILAGSLLETLKGMEDEDVAGAEKLLIAYLIALIRELTLLRTHLGLKVSRGLT